MSYYQQIYNRLRQAGMTEAGALGVLGNWECESNCEPMRVQGDFSSFRTVSKDYMQRIENGSYTKEQFRNDKRGWGLAQWTYPPRKANMYDAWKKDGRSIADVNFQIDFALGEFLTDFTADLNFLNKTNDIEKACETVCVRFENPAVHNVNERYKAALRIKGMIDLNNWDDDVPVPDPKPEPAPQPTPSIDHSLKLRTIDYHCVDFAEMDLLWAILALRNYERTWEAVKQFQADNGLVPDGIVGNLTWAKLLER